MSEHKDLEILMLPGEGQELRQEPAASLLQDYFALLLGSLACSILQSRCDFLTFPAECKSGLCSMCSREAHTALSQWSLHHLQGYLF